jgi:hypothetical protein
MSGLTLAQYYECAFRILGQAQQLDRANIPSCVVKYQEACQYFRAIVASEPEVAKKQLIIHQLVQFEARITQLTSGGGSCVPAVAPAAAAPVSPASSFASALPLAPSNAIPGAVATSAHSRPVAQQQQQQQTPKMSASQQQLAFAQLEDAVKSCLGAALALDEAMQTADNCGNSKNSDAVAKCIAAYMAAADKQLELVRAYETEGSADSKAKAGKLKGTVMSVLDRVSDLKVAKSATFTNEDTLGELLGSLPEVPRFLGETGDANLGPGVGAVVPTPSAPPQPLSNATPSPAPAPAAGGGGGGCFTAKELDILRKSSIVNGSVYQPWLGDEQERETFRPASGQPFCDPDGLLKVRYCTVLYRTHTSFLLTITNHDTTRHAVL